MSITLYSEPDFKGDSFTFDPKNVQTVTSVETNGTAQFFTVNAQLVSWNSTIVEFTLGSIRNNTEDFFLIVNDINNNLVYPFYGSIKNTKFIDKSVLGYIRVEKYPKNYKTLMIVFICLFIFMILMFSVLFITGFITIHTSTVQY